MTEQPSHALVRLYNVDYSVDLESCRVRLLERVAELRLSDGNRAGMQAVAEAAGVDRATLRRFLRGEKLRVETFTSIITRGLQLNMRDVIARVAA